MNSYFSGKKIWITGASSGIGEQLTYQLAASGAQLIISARKTADLEKVKQHCLHPAFVTIVPMDLADENSVKEAAQKVFSLHQSVDVLFNNGGISQRAFALDTSMEVVRKIFEVNFFGNVLLAKLVAEQMLAQKSGHIVVMSSLLGKWGFHMRSSYAATKHALHGFYDSMRMETEKDGLHISCSVTPYHLVFNDEDLVNYDTNLKVNPPLRTKEDVAALQDALRSGDIDCIASHHTPQCGDDKVCEFEFAKNGMITLQTLYGTVNGIVNDTEMLVKMLTEQNRKTFGLTIPKIEIDARASLTIFEPATKYIFEGKAILSKSKNSAFIGKEMKGKVIGIINKNKLIVNN